MGAGEGREGARPTLSARRVLYLWFFGGRWFRLRCLVCGVCPLLAGLLLLAFALLLARLARGLKDCLDDAASTHGCLLGGF
jgi:hypothetical protein